VSVGEQKAHHFRTGGLQSGAEYGPHARSKSILIANVKGRWAGTKFAWPPSNSA